MRRFALLILTISALAMPGHLLAETCGNRRLICNDYCARNYNNAPRCLDACNGRLAQCLQTGCWDSNITVRRCGLDRQ